MAVGPDEGGLEIFSALGEWTGRPGPLHRKLAASLRAAIARGELADGFRLPSERALAQLLSVSRSTVVAAYDELRAEGRLQSRQGSGTVVRRPDGDRAGDDRRGGMVLGAAFDGFGEDAGATIELTSASLTGSSVISADAVIAAAEDIAAASHSHGYAPHGLPALRDAVAEQLTRSGLRTVRSQVLITTGSQQAISLAVALLVRPGNPVLIENPSYTVAIDSLRAAGAAFVTVPVDGEGCRVDLVRDLLRRVTPRAAYLCPTFHSPTGVFLTERRRRELARVIDETGLALIEDNALADTSLGTTPPAPIAAFARTGAVITIGTMSKVFWGGLRVGWIRAPEPLVDRLVRLKVMADHGSSIVSQVLALRLLPGIDQVKAMRQAQALERLELVRSLIGRLIPDWTWNRPDGGLLLWIRLPRGDATEFAQVALRHGVAVVPGSAASPDGTMTEFLRFPFAQDPAVYQEAVPRLAQAWAVYTASLQVRDPVRFVV